jgi:hypothetical protein
LLVLCTLARPLSVTGRPTGFRVVTGAEPFEVLEPDLEGPCQCVRSIRRLKPIEAILAGIPEGERGREFARTR